MNPHYTSRNGFFSRTTTSLRVGFFLALRQIRRSNMWTTSLIIFIMMLTFMNLVVVTGILVGLVEGISQTVRSRVVGDIFISNLNERTYIEQSQSIIKALESTPDVISISPRYAEGGTVTANYKVLKKRETDLDDSAGTIIVGIDPATEDNASHLSELVVEGEYLEEDDYDQVLIGANLLKKYLSFDAPGLGALDNVEIGTKVKIGVNGNEREVTVKGIVRGKVDEVDRRVFFVDNQLRGLIGRSDYNVDEIMINIRPGADAVRVKQAIVATGADQFSKVQTYEEGEPKFVKDIKQTFAILGNLMSSLGLAVASITIFIVVFINAITHRKHIGILKGVGIHGFAIEFSYVLQSLFYAVLGTGFGLLFVFGFLKPYLDLHPIDFPFSDGILVATFSGTAIRIFVLFLATLVAGYIPAKIVVRQNTLDAILGR